MSRTRVALQALQVLLTPRACAAAAAPAAAAPPTARAAAPLAEGVVDVAAAAVVA